jgi:hypothetical protein
MPQSLADLSPASLRRAAALKEKIATLQSELTRLLGGVAVKGVPASDGRRKKRVMTPEWRANLAAAQRRRWAKVKRKKAGDAKAA